MSGILFYFGLLSILSLSSAIMRHGPTSSLIIEGCFSLSVPLALWLLSDSKVAFGIAFWLLLCFASLNIVGLLLQFTHYKPNVPPLRLARLAVTFAFPCIVAMAMRRRAKTEI
jgi:hypothetical protein